MGFNKGLIISSLFVSMIFLAASSFMLYAGAANGVTVEPQYQSLFNNYNETLDLYQTNQQIVDTGQINAEGFDQGIFKNVIIANKQIAQSTRLMRTFISEIPTIILIPTAILTMFVVLIMIMSLMSFIRTITKVEP